MMQFSRACYLIGVVVLYLSSSIENVVAQQVSLIPSAPPKPTATATPDFRSDKKAQKKKVHDFFKAFGWLRKNESIPDSKFPDAVRKIQQVLRKPATGVYDQNIDSVLSRPRCGTIPPQNAQEVAVGSGIHKRFVMWGPKWNHSPVTYTFTNYTSDVSVDQQRSVISDAYASWQSLLPISIVPAASGQKADIHIQFASFGPNETAYAFTNMVADGLDLASGIINITFNDDYRWSDDRLFAYTALHETGHTLGMSHSKVEDAVMFLYFDGYRRPLHPDDEAGIHGIYGWKNPKWSRIDGNTATTNVIQVSSAMASSTTPSLVDGIYQLRSTGQVLLYNNNGGWTTVDNNKNTTQIAGANGILYKRHTDGSTHKYSGSGTSWQQIGAASDSVMDIVAAADQIYVRRSDGWVTRWSSKGLTWTTIQQPSTPYSAQIAVTDSKVMWNLLTNGDIVRTEWPYTSSSWQIVNMDGNNAMIAVGGEEFYKLQKDNYIVWLNMEEMYWDIIDQSPTASIYAVGKFLYKKHTDGSIWRYTGTPFVWEQLDARTDAVAVIGDRQGGVYEMLKTGDIYKLVS